MTNGVDAESRFFVDERSGCIAVRDRLNTDPDYPGLHADTAGVVWFEFGVRVTVDCPSCGRPREGFWEISDNQRERAKALADSKNNDAKATTNEELVEAIIRNPAPHYAISGSASLPHLGGLNGLAASLP